MCILCAIQSWSRRFATMLPWLVIPLIGLWALSQLLPPAFRFEITSPRLACVAVLLVTLLWYEFLMPQLSAWRVRRNARIRERKRIEAIELHKLRKTATRRCRNCLTPYRDQNPGGGKFMCSYCGHISKRPVLDLPVPPGMGNSGILKDLVGKGGKILNGKAWSDNGWMCGQEWLDTGNWAGVPFSEKPTYWKNGDAFFSGEDHCLAEKSYSRIFTFACKALAAFFLSVLWLWRKIFRISSSRDDASADAERRGLLDKRDEGDVNSPESRGKKARRKAEEKRQARLEKELLEEEERKQREEVARLVEERRRLRDEKLEAEKERGKISPRGKEKDGKKESDKKCAERKKEKDRSLSKSNSERNKKAEGDRREHQKASVDGVKTSSTEMGIGFKGASANTQNRDNAGTRYLDRMKGTFLSSSRAFSGGGFFGKGASNTTIPREHKPNTLVDHALTSTHKKEIVQSDRGFGRGNMNGEDRIVNRPVFIEPQPPAPKKSWQQLFTRSNSVSPPNSNVICRPNGKHHPEAQSPPSSSYPPSSNNPINFGLSFALPQFPVVSTSSGAVVPSSSEAMFSRIGDASPLFLPEESEIFEDPCYVPDPISLLGPVSESLDNFQLDLGFVTDSVLGTPRAVKTVPAPSDVAKPSPIESPLSRLRVSEERHNSSLLFSGTPKAQDTPNTVNGNGSWQMWNSPPLCPDSLGFGGGSVNWLQHSDMNMPHKEDMMLTSPQKTMASLFKTDEKIIPGNQLHGLHGNYQNGGTYTNSVPSSISGPWLPFGIASNTDNHILMKPNEEVDKHGPIYGNVSAPNQQFELPAANSWAKKDWTLQGSRDGHGESPVTRPQYGGLYSDVQSFWS